LIDRVKKRLSGFEGRDASLIQESERSITSPSYELELSGEQMRKLVNQAMDRIVPHILSLPEQSAADVDCASELARSLIESMPEQGTPMEDLLDLLFNRLVSKGFNTAGPGYLAYIPGGGIFHSAVADLIANAVNRYVGVWIASPGLAQLEANVTRWFCDMIGYPREARGVLTTGGSLANFTALVTARRSKLPENFLNGMIYASDQIHHSVVKAAILAGFPETNIREVPSDERFRIRTDRLLQMLQEDRKDGKIPFLLAASAGTTNTGAVDDLESMAAIAASEGLWLHVDAAYGGFFALTTRGQSVLRGIEKADSITLDPHKALFVPYGTGSLLVRNGENLRRAHSVHASYLPPMQEDQEFVDFCLYSPELSRDFRGLRVWLPLKLHGIGVFRRQLDEKLDLATWATRELRQLAGIEIVAEPQLSIVAFRLVRPGLSIDALNELNHRLLERINERKRVYLTSTTVRGLFVIRICVLSFRTHLQRMEAAIEDIRESLAGL
jgi:aromatic-L-amino-acid decarboxylase